MGTWGEVGEGKEVVVESEQGKRWRPRETPEGGGKVERGRERSTGCVGYPSTARSLRVTRHCRGRRKRTTSIGGPPGVGVSSPCGLFRRELNWTAPSHAYSGHGPHRPTFDHEKKEGEGRPSPRVSPSPFNTTALVLCVPFAHYSTCPCFLPVRPPLLWPRHQTHWLGTLTFVDTSLPCHMYTQRSHRHTFMPFHCSSLTSADLLI